MNNKKDYGELQKMFGSFYSMPPEEMLVVKEIEYRCPYQERCEARAKCFAVSTPEPLGDDDVLYVRCRLMGGDKIPVYAKDAKV